MGEWIAQPGGAAGCGGSTGAGRCAGCAVHHLLCLGAAGGGRPWGPPVGTVGGAGVPAALQHPEPGQLAAQQPRVGAPRSQPADCPAGIGWAHHHPCGRLQGGERRRCPPGHRIAALRPGCRAAGLGGAVAGQLVCAAANTAAAATACPGAGQLPHPQQPPGQWRGPRYARQRGRDARLAAAGRLLARRPRPAQGWRCADSAVTAGAQQRSRERPSPATHAPAPGAVRTLVCVAAGRGSGAVGAALGLTKHGFVPGASGLSDPWVALWPRGGADPASPWLRP